MAVAGVPSTKAELKRIVIAAPNQSDEQRMNRFQKGLSGGSVILTNQILDMFEDRTKNSSVAHLLHGPLYGSKRGDWVATKNAILEQALELRKGRRHWTWMRYQRNAAEIDPSLAGDIMGINIVTPRVVSSDAEMPVVQEIVLIANKDDAMRIAMRHIKKQPNFTAIFFQSLIATTDNDHWKKQRNHLNEVFMPKKSLAKIFPTLLSRAKTCAARLGDLSREAGPYGVQMHEFYLHEAQAQLQLALFGMDEDFVESTNKKIRDVFSGTSDDPNFGKDMCLAMMRKVEENPAFATASDPDVLSGKKPVFGPLSKSVADAAGMLDMNVFDQFGNMMLILFAGHDTTAHTMTWFSYEMARHPQIQARVQSEVDALYDSLGGKDMTYEDCSKLPFMTRCVMETLRLWPAVPNGTFRELEADETVSGPGGKPVTLPAGTYVQITNLPRHKNPVYWGPDADVFNPDREFADNEVWGGAAFHASNPASTRFSPFTYAPRECLGKNFAQMEMRAILANVFRRFTLELSEPYARHDPVHDGPIENVQGTMGPRDVTPEGLEESARRLEKGMTPTMAMYLKALPRHPVVASKL